VLRDVRGTDPSREELTLNAKLLGTFAVIAIALLVDVVEARAQNYPIVEEVAQRVIEKYQSSSCAQLAARRGQQPSPGERRAVQLMHDDPAIRSAFIGRIAAPIANKLFECGLIP
jgi:hypothetical protein